MNKTDRKLLLTEVSKYLSNKHDIKQAEQAKLIGEKIPKFTYNRLRNLKFPSTTTSPSVLELNTYFDVYAEELQDFKFSKYQPSEEEKKWLELEAQIKELKDQLAYTKTLEMMVVKLREELLKKEDK